MRQEVKIDVRGMRDLGVDDGSCFDVVISVVGILLSDGEESRVVAFLHDQKSNGRLVIGIQRLAGFSNCCYLAVENFLELPFTDSVAAIIRHVLPESFSQHFLQTNRARFAYLPIENYSFGLLSGLLEENEQLLLHNVCKFSNYFNFRWLKSDLNVVLELGIWIMAGHDLINKFISQVVRADTI